MNSLCVASYLLCSLFGDVYSKFNYISDIEQYGMPEYRVSFAQAVKNNQDFRGDCDDFAYTMRELLHEQGYDTEIYIMKTYIMSGSKPHMVLRVKENDENNSKNDPKYSKIPSEKIPLTESLMDTYKRVIPYYENEKQALY